MIYVITSLLFFISNFFLIISRPINIFPEFFFFPSLFMKGFLMYRDFFDHHGFLLFLLLAPLSLDRSLFLLKLFFIVTQLANLALMLIILRRTTTRLGYFLFGILFVLINFWFSQNSLWYEQIILTCYLLIFLILILKHFKLQVISLSLLIFAVSLIKPNAIIILVPVIFITKKLKIAFHVIIGWVLVGLFFLLNGGLSHLIKSLLLFNFSFLDFRLKVYDSFIEREFAIALFSLLLGTVILAIVTKNVRKIIPSLLFTLFSLSFLLNYRSHVYFLPGAAFALISFATMLHSLTSKVRVGIFIFVIIVFSLFTARKVKHFFVYSLNSVPYVENVQIQQLIKELKPIISKDKQLYVLGNQVEVYYFLDKKPPVYFPLVFPFISSYFYVEARTIEDLRKNNVEYVVVPQPESGYHRDFMKLKTYINHSFSLVKEKKGVYKFYKSNK